MDKTPGAKSGQALVDDVTALVEPVLASLGLALWGVEYLSAGARPVLRLYIEKAVLTPERRDATIDECAEASYLVGLALEVEDLVPAPYVLEVSTPGLERRFFKPAQLAAAQGRQVEITLLEAAGAVAGRKKYTGKISSARILEQDWLFTLRLPEAEGDTLEFLWSGVKKARQLYIEPPKSKPGGKGRKTADENGGPSK
jgi:ribosome maturation factor RimP